MVGDSWQLRVIKVLYQPIKSAPTAYSVSNNAIHPRRIKNPGKYIQTAHKSTSRLWTVKHWEPNVKKWLHSFIYTYSGMPIWCLWFLAISQVGKLPQFQSIPGDETFFTNFLSLDLKRCFSSFHLNPIYHSWFHPIDTADQTHPRQTQRLVSTRAPSSSSTPNFQELGSSAARPVCPL